MNKRISALLLTAALLLCPLSSCGETSAGAGPVTGVGSAQGYGGKVRVKVRVSDGAIESVTVTSHNETPGVGSVAVERLPAAILAAQSTQVDGVSGATVSSSAILAATEAALAKAGLDPASLSPKGSVEKETWPQEMETDVVIVGAGGAGMIAGISAAMEGKRVMILEKAQFAGGNTTRSTGGMNAAGSEWQQQIGFYEGPGIVHTLDTAAVTYPELADQVAVVRREYDDWVKDGAHGYFDSIQLMILDTLVAGKAINNTTLVSTLARNSARGLKWLSSIGIELNNVGAFGGASVKRIHRPVNSKGEVLPIGAYMVPILEQECIDNDVRIVYGANVTEILTSGGRAVGVRTEDGMTVHARSVILATGGFGADLDMVAQYRPDLKGFITTNAPGCTGDGIRMAQDVGAGVVDMDYIQIHPTVEQETAALITEGLRGDGAILVNDQAQRFCNEVDTRGAVSAALLAQTGGSAYLILDQRMADASEVIQGYIKKGYTIQGGTWEELARAIAVDPVTLTATMEEWNRCVQTASDPKFGRASFAQPLDAAPFYAIRVAPGIHHTMGGVVINSDARVLDTQGKPIPGLYAAGEVTGGIHGADRLGGNAIAEIVVFGRIAGANAAKAS